MTQKIIKLQSPMLSRRHHCFTRHILLVLQISSTDDLLNKEFKFGVLKGSPIARTLELSQTDEHKKLWENINSHRHGLRNSNNDGIRRARWDEKYAFLIEGMLCQMSSNKMQGIGEFSNQNVLQLQILQVYLNRCLGFESHFHIS